MDELIDRVNTITQDKASQLSAAWSCSRTEAQFAARDAAWDAIREQDRQLIWRSADNSGWCMIDGNARSAVIHAALALAVSDSISLEQFNLLYGPWASVMEA
jgi:hypothetical protein